MTEQRNSRRLCGRAISCGIDRKRLVPQRYILAIMCFTGSIFAHCVRSLPPSLLQIILKDSFLNNGTAPQTVWQCPRGPGDHDDPITKYKGGNKFEWTPSDRHIIALGFTMSHIIGHVPFGLLSNCVSGKWMFFMAMLTSSLCTIGLPILIERYEVMGFLVNRIILGCGQAALYPSVTMLMAYWIPLNELGRTAVPIIGSGPIGVALIFLIVEPVSIRFHWHYSCYILGTLNLICCICFAILCFDSPTKHPFISAEEKNYLANTIPDLVETVDFESIPWTDIFHCVPFWAIVCSSLGHLWTFVPKLTDNSNYLITILRFSDASTKTYTLIEVILYTVVLIGWGFVCDHMMNNDLISANGLRNINTAVSALVPAILTLAGNYARCQTAIVVFFLTVAFVAKSFFYAGAGINVIDISRNYAGIIMTISNILSLVAALLRSLLSSYVKRETLYDWRNIFYLAFVLVIVTTIIYIIWSSSERQPWDVPGGLRRSHRILHRTRSEERRQTMLSKRGTGSVDPEME